MMRVSTAHLREPGPQPDGTYRAVTILNRSPHGIMVWAGKLYATSADIGAEEISPGDYAKREAVSFMAWNDAIEYFKEREYESLINELMRQTSRKLSDRQG